MIFRQKKGMTLVEMLVAIAIFTLVMGGFALLANRTWSSNRSVLEQATATTSSTRALEKMIKELRKTKQGQNGAYPIQSVEKNAITFFVNTDPNANTVDRVHYFLENGMLKRGVTKFNNGAYAAGDEQITVLLNYVTNAGLNKQLFYYYGNDYPENVINNPMAVPVAQDVKLIKVELWVNVKPIVAPENMNFESFVELRNLNEY